MMYSLDEIGLIPAEVSTVKHRADVHPFVQSPFGGEKLPVFVAPMTCILNANNICTFSQSKVEPILPVCSGELELRIQLPNGSDWQGWAAVTLQEFDYLFNQAKVPANKPYYILIDVANGHMSEMYEMVKHAKDLYSRLTVMIGNIANPMTYIDCCKARVDYVRVGIGGGAGCTTSVQTGIHASMPWLLTEIKRHKVFMKMYEEYNEIDKESIRKNLGWTYGGIGDFRTKIVADGGINTIAKAIKCLALGADYVMMGKCFAECEEGTTHEIWYKDPTSNGRIFVPHHLYYGQSSEEGQKDRFGKAKSNPEGVSKWIPVTTNLSEFCGKFEAALRSAMSYCNASTLNDFIGKVKYETMTHSEFDAYIK